MVVGLFSDGVVNPWTLFGGFANQLSGRNVIEYIRIKSGVF